ncbi:MAG: hypothetical protein MJ214_04780 [Bacilli bacterium]|nr:hypothetical protein [Bacilli bacterium]
MKKIGLLAAPLTAVALFASCGCAKVGFGVNCGTIGVTLTNKYAYKGEDFTTEIGIDTSVVGEEVLLPDTLDKVTSGNRELIADKEYTYTLKDDKKKAEFKMSGKCIEGITDIELSLVDHTTQVIEEEFYSAISLYNVEFMQVDGEIDTTYDYGETGKVEFVVSEISELSPTVTRNVEETVEPEAAREFTETFVSNNKGVYTKQFRNKKGETLSEPTPATANDWITPKQIGAEIISKLEYQDLQFKDFSYDNETQSYTKTITHETEGVLSSISLFFGFKNKQFISFVEEQETTVEGVYSDMLVSYTYAYETKTPEIK